MKKLYLFSLTLLIPFILQSQVCVTLYQGDDFGLEDRENRIETMGMDRQGNMWFGIKGIFNLVGKYDGNNWITVNQTIKPPYLPLPDPRPVDMAIDREDSIWIATSKGLGIVNTLTMEGRAMTPANSDLPEANVTAIAVDSNNVR